MKKSKLLTLSVADAIKGIIMVIVTAIVTGVYELLSTGLVFDWIHIKPILLTSIAAALSYIIKNFLTNSEDKFLAKEKKGK